jgi:branched-chain amino acid transport system substrate-binding protein
MSINQLFLPVALLCAVACAACDKSKTPTAGGELTVRIGSVAPLTGPQAHFGKDNENGARMAIEDANARGVIIAGHKAHFELLSEDDQADPKTATIVAQKLVDAKVNGVVGHFNSGTSIPASKIYSDNGIPQISPSATAVSYTAQNIKTAFRVIANDSQQGKALGEFSTNTLAAKRIAVIDDRSAYGQGLADEFIKSIQASGAQIVAREFTTDKAIDFTAVLTSIKSKRPDLLFFGGIDTQGVPMVKQLKALGLNVKFVMGDGGQTPKLLDLAGSAAEGVYASLPGRPLEKMPSGQSFAQRYEAKYKQHIQLYAPYCYDAVNVMIAAMQKADSIDPAKYLPELAKITHGGVTASISFDPKGDIKNGVVTLYQVQSDKWHPLYTTDAAALTPAH